MVSEKIAIPPLGETPITFPVITPLSVPGAARPVKAPVELPRFAGETSTAPNWLPMKAWSPAASKIKEFGGADMGLAPPETSLVVEMLYRPTIHRGWV